ncbi:glycosyltransferase family 2 protein [Bifidobacterium eulemuris]|uniref:Glycosyl transferase n=1 Tax=Bifidobacterium eulemuris TaxID=1765219 RepID=A0A261FYT1_9BIFI|nr:glycosyltransferase [Bifidobacterium eulemuris]OZG64364.1 glycosyl transferase [Bifidobacterium eulemuris]QOL32435.1 glycosyltransferase [Bifidobacterium eulemuris]
MTADPKISVIMPVFNAAYHLQKSIESILNQDYTNWELLLIDDGSTDTSAQICESYARADSRIIFFHKKNNGVSSARNLGLTKAQGDYISFVDPDDYISPSFLSSLYKAVESKKNCIGICNYNIVHTDGEKKRYELPPAYILRDEVISPTEALSEILKSDGEFCGHAWDKLFPRQIISQISFDEGIDCFEDLLFCVEAILNSSAICLTNRANYFYVQHDSSILNRKYSRKYFTSFYALEKIRTELEESEYSDLARICEQRILEEINSQSLRCLKTLTFHERKQFARLFLGLIEKYPSKNMSLKTRLKRCAACLAFSFHLLT